jgi:hypothetical protein
MGAGADTSGVAAPASLGTKGSALGGYGGVAAPSAGAPEAKADAETEDMEGYEGRKGLML